MVATWAIFEPNGGIPVRRRVPVTRKLTSDKKHLYMPFSSLVSCSSLDLIFCMYQMGSVCSLYFPGLRLSRSAEDVCDACVTIDIELLSSELTDERRAELVFQKSMHLLMLHSLIAV